MKTPCGWIFRGAVTVGTLLLWLVLGITCICPAPLTAYVHPAKPGAPEITFEHISLEQGLSQSSVNVILQDRTGFLWLGTEDGLNRYDGYNFVIYRPDPDDPHCISNNYILTLYEDTAGTLWIGTLGGGLNRYDAESDSFTRFLHDKNKEDSLSHNRVWKILEDKQGDLWIGTGDGVCKLNRETGAFVRYPTPRDVAGFRGLSSGRVLGMEWGPEGRLWIGTRDGGLNIMDTETGAVTYFRANPANPFDPGTISNDRIWHMYKDRSGNIWIGTDGGLNRYSPIEKRFFHYRSNGTDPESLSNDNVRVIYEDQQGTIWVGTEGGLNILDLQKERFKHYLPNPVDPGAISHFQVRSVYEDRSGVIWVGTRLGGLNRYYRYKEKFQHFYHKPNEPNSLGSNIVWCLWEDQYGDVWVGSTQGLDRLERENNRFTHYRYRPDDPTTISSDAVWSLYEDREGNLWIGTLDGLNRWDPENEEFQRYPEVDGALSDKRILSFLQDRSGFLWIGTSHGLNRLEPRTGKVEQYHSDPDNPESLSDRRIRVIYEDWEGILWVGTPSGFCKFDRVSNTFLRYTPAPDTASLSSYNNIYHLYEDQVGRFWIASGGGLYRFDRKEETFVRYGTKHGLPNEVIYSILEDQRGKLWMSTNNGISCFDPRTETFRNFHARDGLQSNEFNAFAFHRGRDGEMFFGGINGFNAFFPGNITVNPFPPPVVITDLKVFNRSVRPGEEVMGHKILEKSISHTRSLQLSHRHASFTFEFTGLHFGAPRRNRFAYKMEGLEETWNYVGNRRFVTYTYLPAGDYVFRVKSANSDGVWSEDGTSLELTITPPFWKTTWFYFLLGINILLVILGFYGLRVRQLRRQEKRLTRLVKERTEELKAANEHAQRERRAAEAANRYKSDFLARLSQEIRGPMNAIIGFADLTLDSFLNEDQNEFVTAIRESGEAVLATVNEILDLSRLEAGLVTPDRVTFDPRAVAQYVCRLMIPRLEGKAIRVKCPLDSQLPAKVKGDAGRFRQVLINLMGNAARFTETGEIRLSITMEKEEKKRVLLHTIVRDSGCGIPEEQLEHIFEPFQQVHAPNPRSLTGTGLGLAICRQISRLMEGDVWVESQPGEGSAFHFTAWVDKVR